MKQKTTKPASQKKKRRVSTEDAAPGRNQSPLKRLLFGEEKPDFTELEVGSTTILDILSPTTVDTKSRDHIVVDGVYHAYLYVTGYGYSTTVGSCWLSPLVEAGEGVSLSFSVQRQNKDKILSKIAQTTMVNRSRMRDVGDTRQDYEELESAINSGVAAAFPLASYELSDRNGVFLGLNMYNRSPVFLDIYDDYKYTNGNIWIGGSSGAGKTFTLQCMGGRLPVLVNFCLDEYCNIGYMEGMADALNSIRGFNMACQIVVQSLSQWQEKYPGKEWENQLATFDQTLYMGCNDLTSAEYISKKCGKITIAVVNNQMPLAPLFSPVYSTTRPYSQTKSNTQRDLMLPDEVLRLERQKCIALFQGHRPALLWKLTPEELPDFGALKPCRVIDYIPEWVRRKNERAERQEDAPAPGPRSSPATASAPPRHSVPAGAVGYDIPEMKKSGGRLFVGENPSEAASVEVPVGMVRGDDDEDEDEFDAPPR